MQISCLNPRRGYCLEEGKCSTGWLHNTAKLIDIFYNVKNYHGNSKSWTQGLYASDLFYTQKLLFKKINFRQKKLQCGCMRTHKWHNLTQAQDLGSYIHDQSNRKYYLLANRSCQGSMVHLCGLQVQFCYTRLCLFVCLFFFCLKFIFSIICKTRKHWHWVWKTCW